MVSKQDAIKFLEGLENMSPRPDTVRVDTDMFYFLRKVGLSRWQPPVPLDYNGIRIELESN